MARSRPVRAFTLIELLVVMIIIAIIIAIALPTLAGVRNSARRSGTQQLLQQVANATAAFQTDKKQLPGYFNQEQMAGTQNDTRGFTAMQNMMLDLVGLPATAPTGSPSAGGPIVRVGPTTTASEQVVIDLETWGARGQGTSEAYFVPDAKNFVSQTTPGQMVAEQEHQVMPSLVDSFGQPVLAWVRNDRSQQPVTQDTHFAEISFAPNATPARFYWQPNSAFLAATSLGAKARNQSTESVLGSTATDTNRRSSMIALLGSPAYPYREPSNPTATPTIPSAARGQVVLHSAGLDGTYLSINDRRGRSSIASGVLEYSLNFAGGQQADIIEAFDDVVTATGN